MDKGLWGPEALAVVGAEAVPIYHHHTTVGGAGGARGTGGGGAPSGAAASVGAGKQTNQKSDPTHLREVEAFKKIVKRVQGKTGGSETRVVEKKTRSGLGVEKTQEIKSLGGGKDAEKTCKGEQGGASRGQEPPSKREDCSAGA